MQSQTQQKNQQLCCSFDVPEGEHIRTDRLKLQDLLLNLISNAVKFSQQRGLIAVALKQTDGRFEIAITDQGPGIPPEEQERIYRRFYQVDSSHQQEGNGLGLALCKQILDDCGGTIRAENQSPCGCRFIVTLPEKMTGEEAKQEEAHDRVKHIKS